MRVFSKREAVVWVVGFLAALTLTIWLALKAVDYFFPEDEDDLVVLFTANQTEVAAKDAEQQVAQSRARLVEAQKSFIEYQFGVYRDLTKLLGDMLFYHEQPGERDKWFQNYDSYWRLTSGTMHFVESDTVRDAISEFNTVLERYRAEGGMDNYQNVRKAGEKLIVTLKNDIKSSWTTGELGTKK
jgi:hypothetical protein